MAAGLRPAQIPAAIQMESELVSLANGQASLRTVFSFDTDFVEHFIDDAFLGQRMGASETFLIGKIRTPPRIDRLQRALMKNRITDLRVNSVIREFCMECFLARP